MTKASDLESEDDEYDSRDDVHYVVEGDEEHEYEEEQMEKEIIPERPDPRDFPIPKWPKP